LFFLFSIVLALLVSDFEFLILMTDGSNNIGSSGSEGTSGGNPSGGGGPTPGGPNPPHGSENLGLPKSNTETSMNSDVRYTSDDLKQAGGSEMLNVKNILEDNKLSAKEKNDKVLRAFAELQQKYIESQKQIATLKKQMDVPLVFKK